MMTATATTSAMNAYRSLVSVVIPCFNYAAFVGDAVRSALSQTGVDVEVIVVDDASTDGSVAVVDALASADSRIRLLRHTANVGPVVTFNDGLQAARGELLVRLDADDLLTPGSLARSAAVARRLPSVALIYGHPIHFEGTPPPVRLGRTSVLVWPGERWLRDRCGTGVNVITSPEVVMRMSAVRSVGGQREVAHTHDMEMWLRLATVGDVAYIRGADQAWHREHRLSLSRGSEHPLGLTMLEERRDAYDLALAEASAEMHAIARRALALEAVRNAAHEYDRRRAPKRSVTPLIDFALSTDPGIRATHPWQRLQARVAEGDQWTLRHPWVLGLSLVRRIRWGLQQRRWHQTGVYNRLRPATVVRNLEENRRPWDTAQPE